MQGEKFLDAYEPNPEIESPKDNFDEIVHPLEVAGHMLGEWAFTYLGQPPTEDKELVGLTVCPPGEDKPPTFEDFMRYYEWRKDSNVGTQLSRLQREMFTDIAKAVKGDHISLEQAEELANDTVMEYEQAVRKNTFHDLTACMTPMWQPILDGKWPDPGPDGFDKYWWITRAQRDIAGNSIQALERRRKHAKVEGELNYFSPRVGITRSTVEGRGTEFDVAINLLEIIKRAMREHERKHPEEPSLELTVIAAPPQFEAADYRRLGGERGEEDPKNPNVDFLIMNLRTHEVVGVQAKTRGHPNVDAKYDTAERVSMMDGKAFGNTIKVDVPQKKNPDLISQREFAWSGGLAVRMLLDMPNHGPDTSLVRSQKQPAHFPHRGKKRRGSPPSRRGPEPNQFRESRRRIAHEISRQNEGTNWINSVEDVARRPESAVILKRVGYNPDPYGFFGDQNKAA